MEDDNKNGQIIEIYKNNTISDKLQAVYDLISKDGDHYFNYGFKYVQGVSVMCLMKVVHIVTPLEKVGSLMKVKVKLRDVNGGANDKISTLFEIYINARSYFKETELQ